MLDWRGCRKQIRISEGFDVLRDYPGSVLRIFRVLLVPVNPSDLDRFRSRLREALGSRDLRSNFHAADFLDLLPSCLFDHVRSQLLPVSIVPVFQPVMILGVLLHVVNGNQL